MVRRPDRVVQPDNTCDCCDYVFTGTDRAIMVVRIPDGGADTICVDCWATMLAGAEMAMQQVEDDETGTLKTLLDGVADRFLAEWRPKSHSRN